MKLFGNILKGTGIVLAVFIGLIIWTITGPHSPEEVAKEMKDDRRKAEQMEINGDRWISQGVANLMFDRQQCKSSFDMAFSVYVEAQQNWQSYASNAGKLGRWEQTKNYKSGAEVLARRKIQELDGKIKHAHSNPCR